VSTGNLLSDKYNRSVNIKPLLHQIKQEEHRSSDFLHLTANENQMSNTARLFLGSKLSERYFAGWDKDGFVDLEPFTMLGLKGTAKLVEAAQVAAQEMLGATAVNLSCLSGVHAMMCAILSSTEPGETVMTVHHDHGGHFATQGILQRVGRKQIFAEYNLNHLKFDVDKLTKKFRSSGARAFYMDVSYYLNPHNLREIRAALGKDAIIIYDASHTMGLIMGQQFQAPFKEGADVICANTHKTLPGPQKGMIAFKNKKLAQRANKIINDCLYSSPHTHHLIALATTILEMKKYGEKYARQIIQNSNAIGQAFVDLGYQVRRANTGRISENHQAHIFLKDSDRYHQQYKRLIQNHLSTNFDNPLGGQVFIRIGTQELTRRGMKASEMRQIASFIDRALQGKKVKTEVQRFNRQYQKIHYSFD
jgi:glycine hydroxymethyltransferase